MSPQQKIVIILTVLSMVLPLLSYWMGRVDERKAQRRARRDLHIAGTHIKRI